MAEAAHMRPARVLVVGERETATRAAARLTPKGYQCAVAATVQSLPAALSSLRPEAILFTNGRKQEKASFDAIRSDVSLRDVPLIGDLSSGAAELRAFALDEWVHAEEDLQARVEAALRARRLLHREELTRRRMETLLEITQAATSSLELDQILRIAVEQVGKVVSSDRCSVVLVEGDNARQARVVASRNVPGFEPLEIDLARYPELRRAIETKQVVHVADAASDPLMNGVKTFIEPIGVRSILVQPLVAREDLVGALFLRLSRGDDAFDKDDLEFTRAAAGALANSVRNAQLHSSLRRKMEDLESAYVDRYRELNDANRRLKELAKLKDEMLAVCSHDVRAPLNVLLGHGRMLLDSGLSSQQKISAEAIVRQSRKILELVETLLEAGRGEQARLSIAPAHLDVAELAKETAEELEILAAERGIVVRSETPESVNVHGDEVKLREVLQNLIINAIHHAKDNGEVVVRAQRLRRPDGDVARLMVEDDGAGIPEEQLHTVFDRYWHGGSGTGLGLAICKEFVELHGGEIWAERGREKGALFIVTLPLSQKDALSEKKAPAPIAELPWVLVVEDEPEVAAIVSEILRSRYRVEVARDGAEGLAKARSMTPDLVVMDVFLPKLDGLDAAVALKQSSDTVDIPVILLSAHQGVAEKVRALNLGAVDYLAKPFDAMELLTRCEKALSRRRAERQLSRSMSLLQQSGADPATGLLDQNGVLLKLEQEAARSRRYGRPLSMVVLRPTVPGEFALQACAQSIRRQLRGTDLLGHAGAGRFVIVLPESNRVNAEGLAGRLLASLQHEADVTYRSAVEEVGARVESVEALLERLLALP